MTNGEAVNWLINIAADIGKAEHRDLWHYEQALYEIREMLEFAQPETARRIAGKSRDGMTMWYQCDMCNEPVDIQDTYCSGCGRRLTDADD